MRSPPPSAARRCRTCRPPPKRGLPDFNLTRLARRSTCRPGRPTQSSQKLTAALQAALQDQKVIDSFAELGTSVVAQDLATPEAHQERLASQIELWKPIIEAAGVNAQ